MWKSEDGNMFAHVCAGLSGARVCMCKGMHSHLQGMCVDESMCARRHVYVYVNMGSVCMCRSLLVGACVGSRSVRGMCGSLHGACAQESEHAVFDRVCRTYMQEQYRWECV